MIQRNAAQRVLSGARSNPVVTVTGPRQSGKTTLVRHLFPDKPYASLERPDIRREAVDDPRGFLARFAGGAVLDEIQRAPDLLSYLQGIVDEHQRPGEFILTGSQQLGLLQSVSQSLAGRTALVTLLPLSYDEVLRFPDPVQRTASLDTVLLTGGYPRILDRQLDASDWLPDYLETYVERDVRQVLRVGDLSTFRTFMRLCAGRTAQVVNLSALASDCGVTHNTAKAWLSVLEASYVVHRLAPYHRNLNKRLIKAPKLHFVDTGLACSLLGIRDAQTLRSHPLRGALFETWVVAEVLKQIVAHRGRAAISYFRDTRGREVDLLVEDNAVLTAVECKAGATFAGDSFANLAYFVRLAAADPTVTRCQCVVAYGGDESFLRTAGQVLSWRDVAGASW